MKYRKLTAIIPALSLDEVEQELMTIGVPGMTVTKVHGYGDYRNFFTRDSMTDCARIEIFAEAAQARKIVTTIAKKVHQGISTDGVIAVLPVEEFMHIRDFSEVSNDG